MGEAGRKDYGQGAPDDKHKDEHWRLRASRACRSGRADRLCRLCRPQVDPWAGSNPWSMAECQPCEGQADMWGFDAFGQAKGKGAKGDPNRFWHAGRALV